jgi:hypothetical protein
MTAVTIDYAPRGAALEVFHRREPEVLLDGPAGTGKSRACLEKLHLAAMKYPQMRGIIVRKIRADLGEAAIQTFDTHVLSPHDGVHKVGGDNVRHYDYPNGARIVVAGLDRDAKVMSAEYDMAYAQEATELDEEEWEKLTTRLRNGQMPYQQLIADCNPDKPTHWLNQRCNAGQTVRLSSRHHDNPRLWDGEQWTEYGAAYMGALERLTGARRDRLFKGLWVAAEGMIYLETWDRTRNLIDNPWGGLPPAEWERFWSVDFGYTNPFVCQMWAQAPDRELYLYREIYYTQRLVEDHARQLQSLLARDRKPSAIICDHDAEDRATLERHLGMDTVAARKDVTLGIQAVSERLRPAMNGKPRLFIVKGALVERDPKLVDAKKPTCTEEEIEGYVWSDRTRREEPVKEDDHGMDAKRYMVVNRDWPMSDALHVVGVTGGRPSAWIDPRYVDTDTRSAPSPALVSQKL